MLQRAIVVIFGLLLAGLMAQLFFGYGNLPDVAMLRNRLQAQKAVNAQLKTNIDQLAFEVDDLQNGLDTVEEKARHELSMVKPDEILVIYDKP